MAKVKILIKNRTEIEEMAQKPFPPHTMLISITDYGYSFADLRNRPSRLLQLEFDDVDGDVFLDEPIHTLDEEKRKAIESKYHMFSDEQAFEIGKLFFEMRDKVELIICQCEHGQSRSAAIAAAIMEYTSRNAIRIFESDNYYPNKYVFRKNVPNIVDR